MLFRAHCPKSGFSDLTVLVPGPPRGDGGEVHEVDSLPPLVDTLRELRLGIYRDVPDDSWREGSAQAWVLPGNWATAPGADA